MHDFRIASPVGIERMRTNIFRPEIAHNLLFDQTPIGIAPPINTLFHIPHHKIEISTGKAFLHQRTKISPLHGGRILKFVDHIMFKQCTRFFVNKRRIAVVDHLIEQLGNIRKKQRAGFPLLLHEPISDIVNDTQCIIIGENGFGRKVKKRIVEKLHRFFHTSIQPIDIGHFDNRFLFGRRVFCRPIFRIICKIDKRGSRFFHFTVCPFYKMRKRRISSSFKIGIVQTGPLHQINTLLSYRFQFALESVHHLKQRPAICIEVFFVVNPFTVALRKQAVFFVKQLRSELLDISLYRPTLVLLYLVLHESQQPSGQLAVFRLIQLENHHVDNLRKKNLFIHFDIVSAV